METQAPVPVNLLSLQQMEADTTPNQVTQHSTGSPSASVQLP